MKTDLKGSNNHDLMCIFKKSDYFMKTRLKEGKNGSGKTMEAPMKVKTLMLVFFFIFEIENNQELSRM